MSKTRLVFSAEYFSRINTYHLLEPSSEPLVYPISYLDSASLKPVIDSYLHVENASRPVFNAGIGLSQKIFKQFTILLGACTDFTSYGKPRKQMNYYTVQEDLIFITSASVHHTINKNTLLQLDSHMHITPSEHIPPYTIINQTPEFTEKALLSGRSYSIVLGYTYFFARAE